MMCLPAALAASARAPAAVSFVAATGSNYIASGTSINSPSTPAGVQAGDGLFAIVMHRSTLTPPSGWTLVRSLSNTGAVTQTLSVYRRDSASSSDSSTAFTWTQASSGRMGLAYVLARSSTGAISVAASDSAETDITTSTAYPQTFNLPVLTAAGGGELFLLAVASEGASTVTSSNTYSVTGATVRTTPAQADNRMAALTQARNASQSNASTGTFDSGSTASANYYEAIAMRLAPA